MNTFIRNHPTFIVFIIISVFIYIIYTMSVQKCNYPYSSINDC
jgi:hypothetical protein